MKAKLLSTMVLPALFAACTAEEFTETQNPGIAGRALLDPNFTITVNNGADTRFSWNEAEFGWNEFTAEDMFSAGLVDDVDGTIGNNVQTNYVFSTEDGTNYKTKSQMVEGAYMFFSYPGFESSAERGTIKYDLTSQVETDLNNPTDVIEANQLFVTPLYRLEAETANEKLPLEFVSYWSTAALKIANTSKQSFKIVRVILSDPEGDNVFDVKGTLSPVEMANTYKLVYSYDEEKGGYVLPMNGKTQVVYDDIRTAAISNSETQLSSLVLDCQSYELANGKDVTVYMQVPAGKYGKLQAQVVVETTDEKGVAHSYDLNAKDVVFNAKSSATSTANDCTEFWRGKVTSVYGVTADNKPEAYEIDDVELLTGTATTGKYAASYEDVYALLTDADAGATTIIYNQGTLKLDDQLMALLNRLSKKSVEFLNPIEITAERTANLRGVTFDANATLVKGTVNFNDATLAENTSLVINKGTTAVIADGTYTAEGSSIVNNGSLVIAKDGIEIAQVTNEDAAGKVVGEITIDASVMFGSSTGQINTDAAAKITVNKGKTLTVDNSTGYIYTVGYSQEIINNGTIGGTDRSKFVNNGTITNNGSLSYITNANPAPATNGAKRIAYINNNGTLANMTNATHATNGDAWIVMESEDAEIASTVTNNGVIDNTENGIVPSDMIAKGTICAIYEGNQSGMLGNVMSCNKVVLENGTWNKPAIPASVGSIEMNGVTLTSDAAISLSATNFSLKNSIVEKDLTVETCTTPVFDGTTFNGALTLSAATTLNMKGVTLNGAVTASNVTAVNILKSDNTNVKDLKSVINAAVTMNSTTAALTINGNSVLEITNNGSIGNDNMTITNEGKVINRGTVTYKLDGSDLNEDNWTGNDPSTGA